MGRCSSLFFPERRQGPKVVVVEIGDFSAEIWQGLTVVVMTILCALMSWRLRSTGVQCYLIIFSRHSPYFPSSPFHFCFYVTTLLFLFIFSETPKSFTS